MTMYRLITVSFVSLALTAPVSAFAAATDTTSGTSGDNSNAASGTFSRDGVFGCNYNGAFQASVGAFGAKGGAYVPVADATVELNTGILVYQQCVLREVIDREREVVTAALLKQDVNQLNTGRGGQALFVQQPTKELNDAITGRVVQLLKSWQGDSTVAPSVITSIANTYNDALNPSNQPDCPDSVGDNALQKIATIGCTPITQYWLRQSQVNAEAQTIASDLALQWNWGKGFYPQQQLDASGIPETTVPASVVQGVGMQPILSGFEQLQNANDIGQMVSSLFSGLGNQLLSNATGLSGLTQANGSTPSYLDQLVSDTQSRLRQSVMDTVLQSMATALAIEKQYYQVFSDIANLLSQTIQSIRAKESACWILIQQKVCTGTSTAATAYNTCYDAAGQKLKIATSTVFSQAVIAAQINNSSGLASTTVKSLQDSQDAITALQNLILEVQGSTSNAQEQQAATQFDALVNAHKLHTTTDVGNATDYKKGVSDTLNTLLQNIDQTWGSGVPDTSNPYDANSGWCNVNNPDTIKMWDAKWKI